MGVRDIKVTERTPMAHFAKRFAVHGEDGTFTVRSLASPHEVQKTMTRAPRRMAVLDAQEFRAASPNEVRQRAYGVAPRLSELVQRYRREPLGLLEARLKKAEGVLAPLSEEKLQRATTTGEASDAVDTLRTLGFSLSSLRTKRALVNAEPEVRSQLLAQLNTVVAQLKAVPFFFYDQAVSDDFRHEPGMRGVDAVGQDAQEYLKGINKFLVEMGYSPLTLHRERAGGTNAMQVR